MQTQIEFNAKCLEIRKSILETAFIAQKGHIPSAFSIVEIIVALYYNILNVDMHFHPKRDRFILSKGHGCLALYAVLADLNFFPKIELTKFCTEHGILGGHPSRKINGVEVSTGSLGHGPSLGLGMALAQKLNQEAGQVFVVVGDGECNEGSVWEAALSAHKNQLDNFWIIVDSNKFQSYDSTDNICPLGSLKKKWDSFGFHTKELDLQNDSYSFFQLISDMKKISGPKCIISHSIKGMGSKTLEGNLFYHHLKSMSPELFNQLTIEIENYA